MSDEYSVWESLFPPNPNMYHEDPNRPMYTNYNNYATFIINTEKREKEEILFKANHYNHHDIFDDVQ